MSLLGSRPWPLSRVAHPLVNLQMLIQASGHQSQSTKYSMTCVCILPCPTKAGASWGKKMYFKTLLYLAHSKGLPHEQREYKCKTDSALGTTASHRTARIQGINKSPLKHGSECLWRQAEKSVFSTPRWDTLGRTERRNMAYLLSSSRADELKCMGVATLTKSTEQEKKKKMHLTVEIRTSCWKTCSQWVSNLPSVAT